MIIIIIYHKLKIEFYEYYKTDWNIEIYIDIFKHWDLLDMFKYWDIY